MIRYVFEQGWYGLYANLPARSALALNHREAGENHAASLGARDTLLMQPPPVAVASTPAASSSSHSRFADPSLASLPLFGFHLQRITTDPIVLRQRAAMVTPAQLKRGCQAKE
jgi:hypothetical protein